jgi:hypothetical protein
MSLPFSSARVLRILFCLVLVAIATAAYQYAPLHSEQETPKILSIAWTILWWPFVLAQDLATQKNFRLLSWPLLIVVPLWWTLMSAILEKMALLDVWTPRR